MRSKSTLGQRLRELRAERDLSQMSVAVDVGMSRAHLAKIETDADMPSRQNLAALASFFGVSMDYLETGSEAPRAQSTNEALDSPEDVAWALLGRELAIEPTQRDAVFDAIRKLINARPPLSAATAPRRRRGPSSKP